MKTVIQTTFTGTKMIEGHFQGPKKYRCEVISGRGFEYKTMAFDTAHAAQSRAMQELVKHFGVRLEDIEFVGSDSYDDDGLDSEGYPRATGRVWSDDEMKELRRREHACDNYGDMSIR